MNRGWHFEIHSTLIGQISCTDYELLGHGQLAAFLQFLKLVTPTSLWEDILPPLSLSFGNKRNKILCCFQIFKS